MQKRPLIGMPCDIKRIGKWDFHAVGDKYIQAVQHAVGDVILLPALADQTTLARLLPLLDGLFLTGAYSNIEPHHYGEGASRDGTLHDPARDGTTLPLIHTVLEMGMPLMGVCRGFQEINVALGGTLHQHIQELPGHLDHREPDAPIEVQYGDAHPIRILDNTLLKNWLHTDTVMVNSLHQQGVKDLASGLTIEAVAPDGIIEAFRIDHARLFGYAVQWHPEWQYDQKAPSIAIFNAYREACESYHKLKQVE
ncbi:gamma-glutamyl-gamma-aminobutyrate hydrolase family protein [Snodgrassella sp. CFCC 13594]|uniref:gamma-glutamyl-gamma-aminobutyrate hydrolase family protein n=1 Tax=Snodgrassella sp. CFCC 13594 TaxID=1775559 RepID=UPI0008379D7E|nr:gamma-glutamyl-gamma-aminobutyrate hydrolase family protein [Snodgrassella sp. CFCC 13594]